MAKRGDSTLTSPSTYDFLQERSRWESLVSLQDASGKEGTSKAMGWVVPVAMDSKEWSDMQSQYPELLAAPGGLFSQTSCIPLHGGTVLCIPIPHDGAQQRSTSARPKMRFRGMKAAVKALQQSGGKLPCDEYHLRLTDDSTLHGADCLLSPVLSTAFLLV